MKRELWMQALEELPDEWLEEAGTALEVSGGVRRRGRHRWLRIIAAACLILSLCGNVFAVAWVRSRGEQLAQQEDFYLRYLTEAAQDLRSDTFDAETRPSILRSTVWSSAIMIPRCGRVRSRPLNRSETVLRR